MNNLKSKKGVLIVHFLALVAVCAVLGYYGYISTGNALKDSLLPLSFEYTSKDTVIIE